jgi:S-methylmethionine-dependent homocysteine/selenocysteine methylase
MTVQTLAQALAAGPVVLDGGLSNQLAAAGHDLSDALWSARLLADAPQAIADAHRAYLDAGARVLTTASYQATFEGFARRGLGHDAAAELLRRSVRLARDVIGDRPAWVAASVGPYGAMLADGSEYRGRYGLSAGELARFHRPRMRVLADAGADVLACETVPDAVEAEAMLDIVGELGVPAWLSYTVDGAATRAGQSLPEAFAVAAGRDDVIAVGVNCCRPEDVGPAVAVAARVTGKPVVAYPNSGERWDAVARTWTGAPSPAGLTVREWVGAGARLVGGCCRVTPAGIADIARHLGAG